MLLLSFLWLTIQRPQIIVLVLAQGYVWVVVLVIVKENAKEDAKEIAQMDVGNNVEVVVDKDVKVHAKEHVLPTVCLNALHLV